MLVRHEPVQERASRRVDALLDAAASVVDSHGVEHLTTALVAARAGASIGTLYRYFPDRVALLAAIATRNADRLGLAADAAMDADATGWPEALEAMLDVLIALRTDEPSYRSIHSGELLDLGPAEGTRATEPICDAFAAHLLERWSSSTEGESRERIATAIGAADALITYAFLRNPEGDDRYLRAARELAHQQIGAIISE